MVEPGHPYFILNETSSLALGISEEDKTSVVGYPFFGQDNQKVRPTVTLSISPPSI